METDKIEDKQGTNGDTAGGYLPRARANSTRTSTRAAVAVYFGTFLYFFILLLVLFVLDRQIYTAKKLDVIRNNFSKIFSLPESLNNQAREVLFPAYPERRIESLEKLQDTFSQVVNGETSMYRLSLLDENGKEIFSVENPEKMKEFNSFDNNLFFRNFTSLTSMNISRPWSSEPKDERRGQIIGKYTSPKNIEEIRQITVRYRTYAVILILGWIGVYGLLYVYLLRPVRNVTSFLEFSRNAVPRLIPSARGPLEQGYNDLAAQAVLQHIEEKIADAARPDGEDTWGGLQQSISGALNIMADAFRLNVIHAAIVGEVNGKFSITETFIGQGKYPVWSDFLLKSEINDGLINESSVFLTEKKAGSTSVYSLGMAGGSPILVYAESSILNDENSQNRYYLERAMVSLRTGISAHEAWQHHVFRQRSEANIVLSRNLGHDLTNIIATSKLELMAVKKILDQPEKALAGTRGQILKQGVSGLLESTKLLQEMVNIYRSFSYVKRPAYERRSLNQIITEFLDVFAPAMSSRVNIEVKTDENIPSPIVEPRLLKLAVFNVLQNALDAFKRQSDEAAAPRIIVGVDYNTATGIYRIFVEDNGPGLRKASGELMSPAEAQAIFDYGFSTRGGEGEGLGLSWVRTIMEDFHDGAVSGENTESGARISLTLKSMERVEARVQENTTTS